MKKLIRFYEFVESDFDAIESFKIKNELEPKIWDKFKLDSSIRGQLLKIGEDFYEASDFKAAMIDIVLTGSLCNYNWSEKYSDYDLHIIIDYNDLGDDRDLIEKACDFCKKIWNTQHNIIISGYEVEVAIQDVNELDEAIETGRMGGVYSLVDDRWIKKPSKVDFELDESSIREKAKSVMIDIDDIEENPNIPYMEFNDKISKVWKKIKKLRKEGLESDDAEFSLGNLVFKLLRRNGYINKVMDMRRDVYDKQFK